MSDDPKPTELPPLPDRYLFPPVLLNQWVDIPASEPINAVVTRQDLELFLFSAQKQFDAIRYLDQTLVAWSNGQTADADRFLFESRRKNIEALNQFQQFFTAIMISAVQAYNNARKR